MQVWLNLEIVRTQEMVTTFLFIPQERVLHTAFKIIYTPFIIIYTEHHFCFEFYKCLHVFMFLLLSICSQYHLFLLVQTTFLHLWWSLNWPALFAKSFLQPTLCFWKKNDINNNWLCNILITLHQVKGHAGQPTFISPTSLLMSQTPPYRKWM